MDMPVASLNAPFGARCFLTGKCDKHNVNGQEGLNAPFGARCFLTLAYESGWFHGASLNAPFGARCFLTSLTIISSTTL